MSNPPVRSKNFAYDNESSKLQRERVWFLTRRSKHAACLPLSPSIKHTQPHNVHSTALQGSEKHKVSGKLGKMRSATKSMTPLSLFVSLVSSGLDPLQPKAQPVRSESTPGEGQRLGVEQKRGLLAATALAAETPRGLKS